MDEIIFRSSEKLENLQIQLSLASQQSKILFQQYSEKAVALANQAWNSPRMAQLQDAAKELLLWILEVMEKSKDSLLTVADPRHFVDRLFKLLRNEMNRRQLLFGCVGFILGSFVGYTVACCLQKPSVFVSHMKAVVCTNYNGSESTAFIDDVPAPRVEEPDDVLIQVKASSVSLIDLEICKGYGKRLRKLLYKYNQSYKSEFPIVLGRSCSGIVLEIGQGVSSFDIGDEVYLTAPYWSQGTISEVCVAKEFRVAHKPKRIGFEGAAGLPYSGCIALNAATYASITKENAQGKRILVCGGCTPSGSVLVQYFHILGAEVTTTTSVKAVPVARALGADDVIIPQQSLSKSDLETESPNCLKKELELRDPFDVIFVTEELNISIDELKKFCKSGGKVISTLSEYLPSDHFGFIFGGIFWSYIRTKCLLQNIFGLSRSSFGEPEMSHVQLNMLNDLVDNNQLQSVVDKVFHPYDIEEAFDHVQSADSIGSSIITFR